jgi:dynein heavy chain 1
VYGGRIDSDFDQRILDAFVDGLFTPLAYNVEFDLVPGTNGQDNLSAPDGTKLENFMSWAERLPDREPPSWLSLPSTAERLIAVAQGMSTFVTKY